MTNLIAMKPVIVTIDTTGVISRCWKLYGADAEGSVFRPHQHRFFMRQCKRIMANLADNTFALADPSNSLFITKDFEPFVQDYVTDWALDDCLLDPEYKPVAVFLMRQLIRLFSMMSITTLDLTRMSFIKWTGNDMAIRILIQR